MLSLSIYNSTFQSRTVYFSHFIQTLILKMDIWAKIGQATYKRTTLYVTFLTKLLKKNFIVVNTVYLIKNGGSADC